MKVYSPHEISELLGIRDSTLRKYSILLESNGYQFQRNKQNQRWYNDNDVIALRKLVTLKDNGDMSLKECAEAVCLWVKGEDVTQPSTVTHDGEQRHSNQVADIGELKELIHKQNELIAELMQRLEKETAARIETERKLFEKLKEISEGQQHNLVQSEKIGIGGFAESAVGLPKTGESSEVFTESGENEEYEKYALKNERIEPDSPKLESEADVLKFEEIKKDPHKVVEVTEDNQRNFAQIESAKTKNGLAGKEKKLSWWQRLFK